MGVISLAVAAVLVALAIWGANRSAFFPSRYPEGDWEARDRVGAEDVTLSSSEGLSLNGWWLQPPDARWATLFLHGNAGNVTQRTDAMREVAAAGSAVMILDYRGYGKSEGSPTEAGLYRDARAAYDFLRNKGWTTEQIVLHGESLGTAVAVQLATEVEFGGIVLEAPFPSARAVASRVLPVLGPLLVWGFDTESRIAQIRGPVLIIHGDRDEVIDIELGRRVFAGAREPKQFWTVAGAGHNNLVAAAGAEYRKRLREFYELLGR